MKEDHTAHRVETSRPRHWWALSFSSGMQNLRGADEWVVVAADRVRRRGFVSAVMISKGPLSK